MSLDWQGDKLIGKMEACIKQGINQTMSAAVIHAKKNHPWQNRTGTLEGSIRPVVAARKEGDEFVGLWGSVDVEYALYLELGLKFNLVKGVASFGQKRRAFPFLRPAAEAEYPNLARNIQNAFESKGGIQVKRESVTLRSGESIDVLRPI